MSMLHLEQSAAACYSGFMANPGDSPKTIITHDGKFHADDVFAVATLLLILRRESPSVSIVRSRDSALVARADFVIDVGGQYNEEKNRFDHHQIGGAGERKNGIPFAAFGLVWKKFGEALAGSLAVAA